MKKLLIITLAVSSFWACKESTTQIENSSTEVASGKEATESATLDTKREHDFDVAGIDNPAAVNAYLQELKRKFSPEFKEELADMISFPIVAAKDKETFLANYDKIVTEKVRMAVQNQQFETLFASYHGCMIGSGEVWFGLTDTKGMAIIAITP